MTSIIAAAGYLIGLTVLLAVLLFGVPFLLWLVFQ